MRPDDTTVPFDGSAAGGDPELAALTDRLTVAGERARSLEGAPRASFAADLRARLLEPATGDRGRLATSAASTSTRLESVPGDRFTPRPVSPRVVVRAPAFLPAPRWTAIAIAAALIVSVVGLNSDRWLAGPATTRASDVAGATLSRAGYVTALAGGMELHEGDVIRTSADGHATLEFGDAIARLSGDAAVRLTTLDATATAIDQLGGRVYHRVVDASTAYDVTTAGVEWTADGTAFDVQREPDPAGGELARTVAVEHDVHIAGPGLQATLDQGDVATVHLGVVDGASADVSIGGVTEDDLTDPWLLENARRDVAAGFEAGIFATLLAALEPSPSRAPVDPTDRPDPSVQPIEPTIAPSDDAGPVVTDAPPTATPRSTPKPTAEPTPKPTPRPTPKPTPKPTATPTPLGSLSLSAVACPGRFTVLAWSKAPADGFHHYQTLRSTSATIPVAYPPVPPVVAPDALYGTDRGWLSAIDAGLDGSSSSYRTVAFTAGDDPIAKSAVKTVAVRSVKALGPLSAIFDEGAVAFGWDAFGGPEACFTWYKIVVSTTDESPDYLAGDEQVWVGENQATSSAAIAALDPGTYHARLQVLRTSESGAILVAQTDPATLVIP